MDLGDKFSLDHLIFQDRICRSCGKDKSLMNDFYLTRKDRGSVSSAYSYECKDCTIKRITNNRQKRKKIQQDDFWSCYPDW